MQNKPIVPIGEILVLAGDVVPFAQMAAHKDFFSYLGDHFEITYWLPGNHEYYYSDIRVRSGFVKEKIKDNVLLVNDIVERQGDIRLLFSTMWSKIGVANEWQIQNGMSDFKVIRNGKKLFDVDAFNELHNESVDFLTSELREDRFVGKTVVVTHHVPTFQHYPEKYKGSVLSEAFAVEMAGLILETVPHYWIYGHSHNNNTDFKIGETTMMTNQLGYVSAGEHFDFQNDKYITIN